MDGLGNPISFLLSDGHIYNNKIALSLLKTINICGSCIIADRAYSCKEICEYIIQYHTTYIIPPKRNTKEPWFMDWHLYKQRHLVECFFHKLKQFCRIATR